MQSVNNNNESQQPEYINRLCNITELLPEQAEVGHPALPFHIVYHHVMPFLDIKTLRDLTLCSKSMTNLLCGSSNISNDISSEMKTIIDRLVSSGISFNFNQRRFLDDAYCYQLLNANEHYALINHRKNSYRSDRGQSEATFEPLNINELYENDQIIRNGQFRRQATSSHDIKFFLKNRFFKPIVDSSINRPATLRQCQDVMSTSPFLALTFDYYKASLKYEREVGPTINYSAVYAGAIAHLGLVMGVLSLPLILTMVHDHLSDTESRLIGEDWQGLLLLTGAFSGLSCLSMTTILTVILLVRENYRSTNQSCCQRLRANSDRLVESFTHHLMLHSSNVQDRASEEEHETHIIDIHDDEVDDEEAQDHEYERLLGP